MSFMDKTREVNNTISKPSEAREHSRYRIKRTVLLRDMKGQVFTATAYDISRKGLQLRCNPHVAYHFTTNTADNRFGAVELKIALPHHNKMAECSIHCKVLSLIEISKGKMALGLSFKLFNENSELFLNQFLDHLTLEPFDAKIMRKIKRHHHA